MAIVNRHISFGVTEKVYWRIKAVTAKHSLSITSFLRSAVSKELDFLEGKETSDEQQQRNSDGTSKPEESAESVVGGDGEAGKEDQHLH